MNRYRFYQRLAVISAALMMLGRLICAQPVHMPDSNLFTVIHNALNLPKESPVTREAMRQLTHLYIYQEEIANLTGLEYATELRRLDVAGNDVVDIGPLRNLTQLTKLNLGWNRIRDVSPLANLTQLTYLKLTSNEVADISPLASLAELTHLYIDSNTISDVSPVNGLTQLQLLHVHNNFILDHSPLDALALDTFLYDQVCDMPPLPLQPRLQNRSFPSIFTAWGGLGWSSVVNQPHLSDLEQMAQHDLYFCCLMHGGEWFGVGDAVVIRGSLDSMIQNRDDYIAQNPNMIFLVGLRAVWDDLDTFPPDSDYWLRDEQGQIEPAWHMGLLNLNHPDLQKRLIDQAVAVSQCGLYDGIFVDGWREANFNSRGYLHGAEAILKGIRERVRPDFLILVNTNETQAPVSAPYINGIFMESGVPGKREDPSEGFLVLEKNLSWAKANLRSPRINALETDAIREEPLDSPANLRWMRAATALSLTFSDGYVLFRIDEWEGVHMHWHYWYDFWDADLGRPVGEKGQLYQGTDGLYIREYTNGWAVYNHSGAPQVIRLPEEVQGVASGWLNTEHALPNLDGEMYLRVTPQNPADVNGDGVVNILDLTLVAQGFGSNEAGADVNGDGEINVFDLVFVANAF